MFPHVRRFIPLSFAVTVGFAKSEGSPHKEPHEAMKHSKLAQCLKELATQLKGEDQLELGEEERKLRGKPWSSYHHITNYPEAVLYPETTEDVSTILKSCSKYNIPVIPFGGGTSLEGQTLAALGGVSVDFTRMDRVLAVHEGDLDATVQAGVSYVQLNELLLPRGLWFPLDPGPGACVGGMCACRCSGSTALRYGSMRENVLALTAVLADGTVVHTGGRARKSSAGYDLTRLLVGSEGTLAVITEATLRLHPIPSHSYALRVTFPSVSAAAQAATGALRAGLSLGRAELMDPLMVHMTNAACTGDKPWAERVTLLFEVTGASTASTQEQLSALQVLCEKLEGTAEEVLTDKEACMALWLRRKQCLWYAMSQCPDREAMITDACVPLSALPKLIEGTRARVAQTSLPCPTLAHAGDGNVHVLIMFRPTDVAETAEAKAIAAYITDLALSLEGTCSGEHGVGVGKKEALRREAGPGAMRLMELIKRILDPQNILNPDKVIDADRLKQ